MAVIRIVNTGQTVETDLAKSILVTFQLNEIPIDTVCGGRARCGRCAVRVLSGEKYLTRKKPLEILRLQAMGAGGDVRLACQTFTRGDIDLEVLNLRS